MFWGREKSTKRFYVDVMHKSLESNEILINLIKEIGIMYQKRGLKLTKFFVNIRDVLATISEEKKQQNISLRKTEQESLTLWKNCLYLDLFWSAFCHIPTEYWRSISLYSVRMPKIMDQNNSEYGHFLHRAKF